jgi:hypothetical protein
VVVMLGLTLYKVRSNVWWLPVLNYQLLPYFLE